MAESGPSDPKSLQRTIAWTALVVAVVAIIGLVYARTLLVLWIVLLAFAIAAVPQALAARRLYDKKDRPPR
jgi:membrane protein implicated in regulation of membrane protease activity